LKKPGKAREACLGIGVPVNAIDIFAPQQAAQVPLQKLTPASPKRAISVNPQKLDQLLTKYSQLM